MADGPKASGLSLYADLLEPEKKASTAGVIKSAPVKYNMKAQDPQESDGKKKDGAYQIPAYLRPQLQNMKAKAAQPSTTHKTLISAPSIPASLSSPARPEAPTAKAPVLSQKSKFEDWVGREDEEISYQRPSWNRNKKCKKKKKEQSRIWSWNDIYDPSLPNNYADYKGSDEQYAEIRDWKARLYYHQLKEINREKRLQRQESETASTKNPMFAPPPNLDFVPPTFDYITARRRSISSSSSNENEHYPPSVRAEARPLASAPSILFEPSTEVITAPIVSQLTTGHDVHSRHTEMPSIATPASAAFEATTPTTIHATPSVSKPESSVDADFRAAAMAKVAAIKAKLDASIQSAKHPAASNAESVSTAQTLVTPDEPSTSPPLSSDKEETAATISRAPVRYTQAVAKSLIQSQTDDSTPVDIPAQSSARPGQKNFAQRYMQKFGYEKGRGLGAQGEGIVTPIIMKAEKRKKRSDAEGGGWAVPANMGKIVGGKKRKLDGAQEDDVEMSPVIKIPGMVNGLDIDYEMQDNNLMQRIGDNLSQDHGNIERIFIWRQATGGDNTVFVKFNSAVSALGAVNRPGGITFAGNTVAATFYNAERFDKGEYA